jgi:hypothetical protein
MRTFTIFNHGTGSHRDRADGEIIATFGNAMPPTDEYFTFLITDGPGSAPNSAFNHPRPGTFNWATRTKEKKKFWRGNPERGDGSASTRVSGLVHGAGWDDNVRHALVVITDLLCRGVPPQRINMIGWSRGAVTCLKIANALWDPSTTEGFLRDIAINIFAIDPVAGGGAGVVQDTRLVTPNVKNYIGTLAQDEQRGGFGPQDADRIQILDPQRSNVVLLPFPGKHNTQVRKDGSEIPEVAEIVWYLAWKFLVQFGTEFPARPVSPLTPERICELYGQMMVKREQYHDVRNRGLFARLQGGIQPRTFKRDVSQFVEHANFFVNQHHRELFEQCFPDVYQWLFTDRIPNPKGFTSTIVKAREAVGQAFQQVCQRSPATFQCLSRLGVERVDEAVGFRVPAPGSQCFPQAPWNRHGEFLQFGTLQRMGLL